MKLREDAIQNTTMLASAWIINTMLHQMAADLPPAIRDLPAQVFRLLPVALDWLAIGWIAFAAVACLFAFIMGRYRQ